MDWTVASLRPFIASVMCTSDMKYTIIEPDLDLKNIKGDFVCGSTRDGAYAEFTNSNNEKVRINFPKVYGFKWSEEETNLNLPNSMMLKIEHPSELIAYTGNDSELEGVDLSQFIILTEKLELFGVIASDYDIEIN